MGYVVKRSTAANTLDSRAPRTATNAPNRLIWLDIVRLLAALMILGIHWLRACYKVGLFGANDPVNLVINYQGHNSIAGMLPHVLIAGTAHTVPVWLTNVIGLLGGFGWEGVSALIIVSGFSLTFALKGASSPAGGWFGWLRKRIVRIVVPFYIVAVPFLIAYAMLLVILARAHGSFAAGLEQKLQTMLQTPPLGVVLSHTLLFDPFSRQWQAQFFAPAWWFIPAILLAYLAFPVMFSFARRAGGVALLLVAGAISMVSYHLSNIGVFVNESWYFIVLHECFNFALGIVAGAIWQRPTQHPQFERFLFGPWTLPLGVLLFVAGNIANWDPSGRLFASMLYGPGLLLLLTVIAKRIEGWRAVRIALAVDAYDLYLVHQPFAFPLALAVKFVLPAYAVPFGWILFVALAALAAIVLARAQKLVFRRRVVVAAPST